MPGLRDKRVPSDDFSSIRLRVCVRLRDRGRNERTHRYARVALAARQLTQFASTRYSKAERKARMWEHGGECLGDSSMRWARRRGRANTGSEPITQRSERLRASIPRSADRRHRNASSAWIEPSGVRQHTRQRVGGCQAMRAPGRYRPSGWVRH